MPDSPTFVLQLYVSGQTLYSARAVDNLRRICETEVPGLYAIEVIDVLTEPWRAEADKILATPTVVRRRPEPVRKIIGDLSDEDQVRIGLDLTQRTV